MKKLSLIAVVLFGLFQIAKSSNDIDTLKSRLLQEYIATADTAGIQAIIRKQDSHGSWDDLNYSDTGVARWEPDQHIGRLRRMTELYSSNWLSIPQNEALLHKIILGLRYWYDINPRCQNWWYNDIGKQLSLGPLAIMLGDKLPEDIMNEIISELAGSFGDYTGQNKLWFSEQMVLKGCLSNDPKMLESGAEAIKSGIQIYTTEGIMPDYSFRQHGAQLYSGGYGMAFLTSVIKWAYRFRGLDIALNEEQIEILRNFILQGSLLMFRYDNMDFQTWGREIARKKNQGGYHFMAALLLQAAAVDTAESEVYNSLANTFMGVENVTLTGDKHFWWTDYHVHRRKNYFFSIHMNSERTSLTESGNNENRRGGYLTDGATTIMTAGDEYFNIFPSWDWSRIPGVTCPDREVAPSPPLWGKMHGTTEFVGAVSDGNFGVAVYDMNHDSTQVKKSWFMFDSEIVCLAAGIKSTASTRIFTTLNQTRRKSKVWLKEPGKGARVMQPYTNETVSSEWIWHANTGYFLPDTSEMNISCRTVEGDWSDIGAYPSATYETNNIVEISKSQGLRPDGQSFAYILVPGISLSAFAKYDPSGTEIMANDEKLQMVFNRNLKLYGIVLHQPQTVYLKNGITVSSDHSCVLLIDSREQRNMMLSVADPTQKLPALTLEVRNKNRLLYGEALKLPNGNDKGKSMTVMIRVEEGNE